VYKSRFLGGLTPQKYYGWNNFLWQIFQFLILTRNVLKYRPQLSNSLRVASNFLWRDGAQFHQHLYEVNFLGFSHKYFTIAKIAAINKFYSINYCIKGLKVLTPSVQSFQSCLKLFWHDGIPIFLIITFSNNNRLYVRAPSLAQKKFSSAGRIGSD
jgi:hypothetical protein